MLCFQKAILFCVFAISFNSLCMDRVVVIYGRPFDVGPGGSIRNQAQTKVLSLGASLIPVHILQRSMCEVRKMEDRSYIGHISDTQSDKKYFLIIKPDLSGFDYFPLYRPEQMVSFTQEQRREIIERYQGASRLFAQSSPVQSI